jgi:hypothetical protein
MLPSVLLAALVTAVAPPPRVVVLPFYLDNLTVGAPPAGAVENAARAADALRGLLDRCGYVAAVADSAAAAAATGSDGAYLFNHPADAAQVGSAEGADWVVVGRLTRAATVVSEFHAQLVDVRRGVVSVPVSVEMKGDATAEALFTKGLANLARELDRGIAARSGSARRCTTDRP